MKCCLNLLIQIYRQSRLHQWTRYLFMITVFQLGVLCLQLQFLSYYYSDLEPIAGSCRYVPFLCVPVASVRPQSTLRSAAHGALFVPRARLELGGRAFAVAAPAAWSGLPDGVRGAPALGRFKQCLKTHLFIQSCCSWFGLGWAVVDCVPTLSVRRPCNVY